MSRYHVFRTRDDGLAIVVTDSAGQAQVLFVDEAHVDDFYAQISGALDEQRRQTRPIAPAAQNMMVG